MDYLDFGDNIDYNKYNALVYLLRKFKKLTSNLPLGAYKLESDYGTFNFSDGFVNVGNNWILENPVTVTSNDVLKNTFYTFNFVVIDVNTTGTVNRRIVSVTAGTGETGTLELTIPSDLIDTDEVILPNFTLEVVFDEHEYYTQLPDVHLSLSVDKMGIEEGQVATITGLLTDSTSTPIENVSLPLNVDGTTVTVITDSTGEFNYAYTGTGTRGKVLVSAFGESVFFYDGLINILGAIVTGDSISLGLNEYTWLTSTGDVVIDWGDGTSDTVNNPRAKLSHTYADGLNEHLIIFDGTVTSLGTACFSGCSGLTSIVIPDSITSLGRSCFDGCTGLTSVTIPSSVTSLGEWCFNMCSGLTSITIPDSITNIEHSCFSGCSGLTSIVIPDSITSLREWCFDDCTGLTSVTIPDSVTLIRNYCFRGCTSLVDYELYWETQPIQYNSYKMPVNTGTVFTIPQGTTSIYTDAGYPSNNLVERGSHNYNLSITADKDIISRTEVATLTATLSDNSTPVSGETLNYQIKHGSTVIDSGTKTTDSNGEATITYTGSGVGDVTFEVSYSTLLQETYTIEDCLVANLSGTKSGTASEWHPLYQLDSPMDVEVSATLTFSRNQCAFFFGESIGSPYSSISISDTNQNPPKYIELLGASAYVSITQGSWSYPVNVKFRYENGVATVYINEVQQAQASMSISPVYIGVRYWSGSSTTITYSDLKIKRL